jgi:hypothetical protein
MNRHLTAADIAAIKRALAKENEDVSSVVGRAADNIEAAVQRQYQDISQELGLGLAELHGKIDYLRTEINEIKQILNSLFR